MSKTRELERLAAERAEKAFRRASMKETLSGGDRRR